MGLKHTFTFTDEELLCLQVCLQNAPCPYDIGKKKLVSEIEDKIGIPPKVEVEPLLLSLIHISEPTRPY